MDPDQSYGYERDLPGSSFFLFIGLKPKGLTPYETGSKCSMDFAFQKCNKLSSSFSKTCHSMKPDKYVL